MASNIDFDSIDETFPIAGIDNDSQGFRDNFTTIKENFRNAKLEIVDLQNFSARLDRENDFDFNNIRNANLVGITEAVNRDYISGIDDTIALGISDTALDWNQGTVYVVRANGVLSGNALPLRFTNWPESQFAKMRVILLGSGTTRTITWATENGTIVYDDTFPDPFTVTSSTAPKLIEAFTYDGGTTVFLRYYIDFESFTENSNLGISGNSLISVNTNGNIILDPNGTGYVQVSGTNGFVVPSGTTAQRSPSVAGAIRFNTSTSHYEGYNGSFWTSLGGVKDVDGNTYISAELAPGTNDDTIRIYNNDVLSASITGSMVEFEDTVKLDIKNITNTVLSDDNAVVIRGGLSVNGNLVVGGEILNDPEYNQSVARPGTMSTGASTNIITVDAANINFFKSNQTLKVFGASADITDEGTTGLSINSVSLSGFDAPGVSDSKLVFSYKIAQFDFTTGKISASSTESTIELKESDLANFQNNKNIVVNFRRTNGNKGILIYRKIGLEVDHRLIAVMGPKDLGISVLNINYVDYYNFDRVGWSTTNAANYFTASSGIVHMPITAPATPSKGWETVTISSVNYGTNQITISENLYSNGSVTIVHDDSAALQTEINSRAANFVNYLELENRIYYVSKITIPDNFDLYGRGTRTKLIKQYWSTEETDNIMISADSTISSYGNVSIRNIEIDGNFVNQYLMDDTAVTALNRNYIVYLYGDNITIDRLNISNVVGGGIYMLNVSDEFDVTDGVNLTDSTIKNGTVSYRYDYRPLTGSEIRSGKFNNSTYKNFPEAVDLTATNTVSFSNNIVENCGSGLLIYGSTNAIYSPNILLGPAGEFLSSPDIFNSEYDSVNIQIEKNVDYNSFAGVYQVNGELVDLSINQTSLVGKINELRKINGVEELSTDYSTTFAGVVLTFDSSSPLDVTVGTGITQTDSGATGTIAYATETKLYITSPDVAVFNTSGAIVDADSSEIGTPTSVTYISNTNDSIIIFPTPVTLSAGDTIEESTSNAVGSVAYAVTAGTTVYVENITGGTFDGLGEFLDDSSTSLGEPTSVSNVKRTTDYIQFTNPGDSSGGFSFRITANNVTELLETASYQNLYANNTDTQGLVYRIIATEYVPQSTITSGSIGSSSEYIVGLASVSGLNINDVVRLVNHSTTPDVSQIDGRIVSINTIASSVTIEFNGGISITSTASSGSLALKNSFVLVKGKIN